MSVTAERLMVEVQADVRQALAKLNQVERAAGSSSGRMMKMARGMAGAFTGAAIVGGIGKTIGLAKDFDLTMRQVGVQTGLTGDKLGKMRDLAMKMGADTAFSAADASQAMLELAKGGLSAAEQKAGALKTTMTLAAAGSLDMANAATYVTQGMTTFGLSAKNANQVAVALAGGANASTASVESLGMALSQVGPGATNAGMSIQETVAALSAFDNAGIKGSDAGTSLKTMLSSLVPSTNKARDAMQKYGLDFVKGNGSMESMANIAGQLQSKLGGLSQAQRISAMRAIFGSDASRAATALMKEGTKGIEGYIKATKDKTVVEKMANTAMGGASGAWEQLKGSVETVAIKMGTALLPAFTTAANGAADFVNALGSSGDELASAFDWVKGFANGFLDPFRPILEPMGGWLSGAAGGAGDLGSKLKPVGDFIAAHSREFGVVAGVITTLFIPAMVAAGVTATVTKVKVVTSFIAQQAASAKAALMVGVNMVKMGVFYVQYAAVTVAQTARIVATWVAQQVAVVTSAARQGIAMASLAAAYVANGIKMAAAAAATAARVVAGWVLMGAQSLIQAARMAGAWVIAMGPVGWVIAAVVALAVIIYKNWDKIVAVTKAAWSRVSAFLSSAWTKIKSVVMSGVNAVIGFVKNNWQKIVAILLGPLGIAVGLIISNWGKIKSTFSAGVAAVKSAWSSGWNAVKSTVSNAWNNVKSTVSSGVARVVGFVQSLPGKIKGAFSSAGSMLLSAGHDIIQGLLDGITSGFTSVKNKLSELTGMLPDWKGPPKRDKKLLVDAGKDIISGLVDGLTESFGDVKKTLRDLTAYIGKSMKGKEETAWLAKVQKANDRLKGLYARRKDIAQKHQDAMDLLDQRKQVKADLVGSMSQGISSQANVLNAGNNAATIKDSLAAQFEKAKAFVANLQKMKGMGYAKEVIAQIAAAGVEQGAEVAKALASGTADQVAGISDTFTAINSLATTAAEDLAGGFYDQGIDAAQRLADGFAQKEDAIKQRILGIAKSLKGALKTVIQDLMKEVAAEAKAKAAEEKAAAAAKAKETAKPTPPPAPPAGPNPRPPGQGPRPPRPPLEGPAPRSAGAVGAGRTSGGATFNFTTNNPVAEPQSRTTNRALARAASLGLV